MQDLYPAEAELYKKVIAHGAPNYMGARITLPTTFPLHLWNEVLTDYHDQQLVTFLQTAPIRPI